nr:protein HESO1 [Ipomoea batatas]
MNGYSPLEHTLRYIICAISPSKDDWSIRFQLIEELRAVVEPIESLRGATVEPFGSFVSDLFTRWGDLDISIELANGSYIASAGKKHKQNLLEDVLKALKIKGGCRKLRFITNARVPILKFQGKYNISCDISINNLSGQMKSKLLYWISTIDGRFRHMVLLVKEWAKAQSINDSKSGTLNSYSLSLLVIFHFQTCEPAILPPLKEIYPRNMVDDLTGVRVTAENLVEETCAVNINRFKSNSSRAQNDSSLADLFISFIEKFCDISSKASDQGISTYTGQWEDIEGNMRWLPKTYSLFIEDPFEQPANTARSVSSTQLANISEAFQSTYNMLTSPNQDKKLLLSTLMKPPTTKFAGGTPTGNYGNYSRDGVRIQQSQRSTQPSLQHQFQDMRINRQQPNRAIHRPSQDSPAQLQPVWRPKYDKKVAE